MGTIFKGNGYNTSWFGKNHNTPDWESSIVGPFDRWPTGLGFDYFYVIYCRRDEPVLPPVIFREYESC